MQLGVQHAPLCNLTSRMKDAEIVDAVKTEDHVDGTIFISSRSIPPDDQNSLNIHAETLLGWCCPDQVDGLRLCSFSWSSTKIRGHEGK
jgi:hypothetical protein